jgi:hypothetical protein
MVALGKARQEASAQWLSAHDEEPKARAYPIVKRRQPSESSNRQRLRAVHAFATQQTTDILHFQPPHMILEPSRSHSCQRQFLLSLRNERYQ